MNEELSEEAMLHKVKKVVEVRMRKLSYWPILCDEAGMFKKGNPDEHYNARFGTIIELIRKIRKLDGLSDNIAHPLIDEIIKVEDYSLETHVTMLTKLLEETSVRHSEGLPPPFKIPNIFAFKFQDRKGRVHLFNCDLDAQSLTQVTSTIKLQVGDEFDENNPPQILYKDEDLGKIVIASDSDLTEAVEYARLAGHKALKLYLDHSVSMDHVQLVQSKAVWSNASVLSGASAVGLCMFLASLCKFRSTK